MTLSLILLDSPFYTKSPTGLKLKQKTPFHLNRGMRKHCFPKKPKKALTKETGKQTGNNIIRHNTQTTGPFFQIGDNPRLFDIKKPEQEKGENHSGCCMRKHGKGNELTGNFIYDNRCQTGYRSGPVGKIPKTKHCIDPSHQESLEPSFPWGISQTKTTDMMIESLEKLISHQKSDGPFHRTVHQGTDAAVVAREMGKIRG
jgi:hypothetical protein